MRSEPKARPGAAWEPVANGKLTEMARLGFRVYASGVLDVEFGGLGLLEEGLGSRGVWIYGWGLGVLDLAFRVGGFWI